MSLPLLPTSPSDPLPVLSPPTSPTSFQPSGAPSSSRERLSAIVRGPRRPKPRRRALPILAGVALVGVASWFGVQRWWPTSSGGPALVTGVVARGALPIIVTERGEIESSVTTDAICEVEGREVKLVSIVPEGTRVTQGQEVCKFDPEKLNRSFAEQEIKWKQAIGKAGAAKGELEVQINKAESEIAKAKLDLTLAELEKDKYLLGEYQVELFKIKGAIELAEKDYQEAKDKLVFYQQFEKKGFGTPEQTRVRELMVGQYEFQLRMNQIALTVLEKFTRKQKETELTAKAEDAARQLKRTEKSTKGAVDKAKSDLEAAEITATLEKQELDRIKVQLERCIIRAPQNGILVYSKDRYWDSSSRIQPGAMVYFRQTIFTIPDLSKMQIKVKVHESVVKKISANLKAEIVMDALPGHTLHGTVIAVGTMAHQDGFWNQGAKEYLTTIRFEDLPESAGMKPGMTGEVKILVNRLNDVLTVPVQAVAESEGRHVAFVASPAGIDCRTVVVGENNDKFVQIKDGLAEGERVALDARARVAAQAKAAESGSPAN
jgi:RND family efflux transporter MFP subunit